MSNPDEGTLTADQDAIIFVRCEILGAPLDGQADRSTEVDRPTLAHADGHVRAEGIEGFAEEKKIERLEIRDRA